MIRIVWAVFCSCQLFAYSVLLCRFVYHLSGGRENYNFTILVFRVVFRDYLASIWLHIIWYLAANLPQKKSYRCYKKFGLFFVFVLITQFAFLLLCKSISAFCRTTQIIWCPVFKVLFTLCLAFITRFFSVDWLLIYHIGDSIDFSWCLD